MDDQPWEALSYLNGNIFHSYLKEVLLASSRLKFDAEIRVKSPVSISHEVKWGFVLGANLSIRIFDAKF